jgi:hypothetical protein
MMPTEQEGARQHRSCDTFFLSHVARVRITQSTKHSHEYVELGWEERERGCIFLSCFYLQLRWI